MSVPKRSRDEWREHVAGWRHSGLRAVEYARQHGLNVNTFSWWRSELRREGGNRAATTFTLVPVAVRAVTTAGTAPIEVALPQGLVVRVRDHADPTRVAQIVRALVTSW